MAPLRTLATSPCRRLAFAAGLLAILALWTTKAILDWPRVNDFLTFWAAGRALNAGLDPYRRRVLAQVLPRSMVGIHPTPYLSPIILAELMRPLGSLPYASAHLAWSTVSVLSSGFLLFALLRLANLGYGWTTLSLSLSALLACTPFAFTIAGGQTDVFVAAVLSGSALLLKARRRFLAGLVLCLGAMNPQLLVGFALYYCVRAFRYREWGLLLGGACGLAFAAMMAALYPHYSLEWIRITLPAARLVAARTSGFVTVSYLLQPVPSFRAPAIAAIDAMAVGVAISLWMRGASHDSGLALSLDYGAAAAISIIAAPFLYLQDWLVLVLCIPGLLALVSVAADSPTTSLAAVSTGLIFSPLSGWVFPWRHSLYSLCVPLLAVFLFISACVRSPHKDSRASWSTWSTWIVAWIVLGWGGYMVSRLLHSTRIEAGLLVASALGILGAFRLSIDEILHQEVTSRRHARDQEPSPS